MVIFIFGCLLMAKISNNDNKNYIQDKWNKNNRKKTMARMEMKIFNLSNLNFLLRLIYIELSFRRVNKNKNLRAARVFSFHQFQLSKTYIDFVSENKRSIIKPINMQP